MDELALRIVLPLLVAILSGVAAYSRRERQLREERDAVASQFSLDSLPQLQFYVRTYLSGLHPPIGTHSPENLFPFAGDRSIDYVKRCARQVGARFGLSMSATAVRFCAELDGQHAGHVQLRGGIYYIDIAKQYDGDFVALFAIIAHEVAHVALGTRGIRLPDTQQNEELTDAATVLAGFGPLMLIAYYSERRWVTQESTYAGSVHRLGYLNPVSMAYLTIVHSELSAGRLDELPSVADGWLKQAWRVRKAFLRRRAKPVVRKNMRALPCANCGTRLRLPDVGARMRLRCPLCASQNLVEVRLQAATGIALVAERLGWRGRAW